MQRPFLRTNSASTCLTLAFSLLLVLTFFLRRRRPSNLEREPGQRRTVIVKNRCDRNLCPVECWCVIAASELPSDKTLQTLSPPKVASFAFNWNASTAPT